MKNILIDIGNSSFCKVACADEFSIERVVRVPRKDLLLFLSGLVSDGPADTVCVSSVAGDSGEITDWLGKNSRRVVEVGASTRMNISVDYDTPETLGADRIAAAVGVSALFPGEDSVIFDFGTAITVDFLSSGGVFKGGNISPGLGMRFNALHHYTGRLPLVEPSMPVCQTGRSTSEAISNGVVLGIMFEVEKYIENNPGARIVFTGGDALFFAKKLNYPIFVVCNLVVKGLFKIVQENNV